MSLGYVLGQLSKKMGISSTIPSERSTLLRFANEAAVELYQTSDMAGSLMEEYYQVKSDQTISLPEYVGQLRAMREADSQIALDLSQLRPRYNQYNWTQEWRNWRLKGLGPLQISIRNNSILTISVPVLENPPIQVSISGATELSANISETLIMDSLTKTTTNNYVGVEAITKDRVNNYDVQIIDIDGRTLSVIPNNKLQAKYQIVDISTAPWSATSTGPTNAWVEVLYKRALPWFQNDTDEFPAVGYDYVWVNKALQLWAEEQGKTELAIAYYQKANTLLAQIHEDANRGTNDVVSLHSNPHDTMNPRVGFGRDWQYGWWVRGR